MSRDWTKAEQDEDLTAYIDGELSELDAKRFEERLKNEPELAALEKALRATMKQVSTLPMPAASQQLRRNVLNRIDEPLGAGEKLRAWFQGWRLVPALGMAAAAAVAVVLVVWPHGPRHGEVLMAENLEVAQNIDLLEDMDVVGLDNPDDLEVVARLDELEVKP
jgi:anti-sigma factor RsiW